MVRWIHAKKLVSFLRYDLGVMVVFGEKGLDYDVFARLTLGALSAHQQRRLVARLLRQDAELRGQLWHLASRFEFHDHDLMVELSSALATGCANDDYRAALLDLAWRRVEDPELLVREFTFEDLLQVGPWTRRLFSWSMGEYLLHRAEQFAAGDPRAKSSLFLALMVVDVLEILGLLRQDSCFSNVVEDLRRRFRDTCRRLGEPELECKW